MKKKKVNFRLPPELLDRLQEVAGKYRGLNMTDLVEIGLDHLLSMTPEDRDRVIVRFVMGGKGKQSDSPDS